jgi:ABC-2 type transport system permease protein
VIGMIDDFRLYGKIIGMTLKSQMEYRTSFILMSLGHFSITFIEFFGMYALFQRFNQIEGWNIYEVSVFYGFINIAFALAEGIGRGFDIFHQQVRKGSFDRMLLRPRNIGLQIISHDVQLMRIGRLAQGLIVLLFGLFSVQVDQGFSFAKLILLMYSLTCAIVFFLGLMIFQATLSFWSVESLEIMNAFTYGGVQTAQYPMDIYREWFQKIFIFVIPIGSVSYYPLSFILRGENLVLACITPLVGSIFFLISLGFFKMGIRYYCSTGS